ncbi:MAG: stage III sporulation protein AF [Clostridium sp.]|nr:stage III sporulation protein AF [Clostridium sp.]
MEAIFSWVKSGLLFGIFASVILMLCPNKSYQKHVGMVVGLLFILVMLHPVMEFMQVDGSTYTSYVRNFLMLDGEEEISESSRKLYQEALELQLMSNFKEGGYPVKTVKVLSDSEGNVSEIKIIFDDEVTGLEKIELYLKNLFGESVIISYER